MRPDDDIPGCKPAHCSRTLPDAIHTGWRKVELLEAMGKSELFDENEKKVAVELAVKNDKQARMCQESLLYNNPLAAVERGPAPRKGM